MKNCILSQTLICEWVNSIRLNSTECVVYLLPNFTRLNLFRPELNRSHMKWVSVKTKAETTETKSVTRIQQNNLLINICHRFYVLVRYSIPKGAPLIFRVKVWSEEQIADYIPQNIYIKLEHASPLLSLRSRVRPRTHNLVKYCT